MDTMIQHFRQQSLEARFSRKSIDGKIRAEILENPEMVEKIDQGVKLLEVYISKKYYPSKMARIEQLKGLDFRQLIEDVFVGIAYCQKPVLFTAVTAQLAGRLGFDDKRAAITTLAEIVAVLCETDAFDIYKADKMASLEVISRIPLTQELKEYIALSEYLPPMVVPPEELKSNYDSGYLSVKESLILGSGNHHQGDICLDVLNIMNQVCLSLDTDFLSKEEEVPRHELDTAEKRDQWLDFKRQSYEFYLLLAQYENEFYLTHKVDKRGRAYAQGYHVSTQGSPFKKASIELAKKEYVEGVPTP